MTYMILKDFGFWGFFVFYDQKLVKSD
jgi:hypothetical protein